MATATSETSSALANHLAGVVPTYSGRSAADAGQNATPAGDPLFEALHQTGATRDAALAELHGLLLRGAHHELRRRWNTLARLSIPDIDDLANQAADDAMTAILAKLDSFRGESRFTTWAYKFALLEAGVKARRRAWEGREISLDDESWRRLADRSPSAQEAAEGADALRAIVAAIESALTPHQREVFTALALNGVPVDVLAERLTSTRGALYKTLHDARRKLRAALVDAGYDLDDHCYTGEEVK
jgi:RNA polymerase sigma-70 factor, ECF subfamily